MEAWQTVLLAFGGNAALIAVLGLLGRSVLEKLIVRDTKRFETDLKAKADSAIEHLRTELQLRTINFGVYVRFNDESMNDHTRQQKEKAWNSGWDAIKNQMPQARQ